MQRAIWPWTGSLPGGAYFSPPFCSLSCRFSSPPFSLLSFSLLFFPLLFSFLFSFLFYSFPFPPPLFSFFPTLFAFPFSLLSIASPFPPPLFSFYSISLFSVLLLSLHSHSQLKCYNTILLIDILYQDLFTCA